MNLKRLFLAVVAAASLSSLAMAETIVTPSTPAPALPGADISAGSSTALAPNQTIYTPRLPSAQELTNAASSQGVAIDRIEQTASQITVVYRYNDGRTNTVAYQTLPAAGAPVTAGSAVVAANPVQNTVVYDNSPRVVYYDPGVYYDPWYYYPPVAVGLGFRFGYHGYYHGGFYRGGFHGWHR